MDGKAITDFTALITITKESVVISGKVADEDTPLDHLKITAYGAFETHENISVDTQGNFEFEISISVGVTGWINVVVEDPDGNYSRVALPVTRPA